MVVYLMVNSGIQVYLQMVKFNGSATMSVYSNESNFVNEL
jgi:hypothetical protein